MSTFYTVSSSATSMAGVGASIGSFFPGAGTAIGAGIGALVGVVGGLFGAGQTSGGGGGGKGYGSKVKEAVRYQNALTLQSLKKDVGIARQATREAEQLYKAQSKQIYEEQLKQYSLYKKERKTAFKQAQALYKDSVKAFDETVDLNDISATFAMNDANRVYNERIQNLNNNAAAIQLNLQLNRKLGRVENGLIQAQMAYSQREAELNAQGINARLRSAVRDGADAIAMSTREFEFNATMAANQLKIGEVELQVEGTQLAAEMASLEGEKNAIIASAELRKQDVLDSLDNAIKEADFAQSTLKLQQDARREEASVQTDAQRRQALVAQGAVIARGQAGRSANKNVQAIAFQSQQAQALIASAIARADAQFVIDKDRIVQQLEYARQRGRSELKSTAIGLDKSAAEFGAAKLRMAARRQGLGIKKLEAQALGDRLDFQAFQTNMSNQRVQNQILDAREFAKIDLASLSNNLLMTQKGHQANLMRNKIQQNNLEAQAKLSFKSLGQSAASARDALTIGRERIKFDQFLANRAAASQVLDEPKMPDLLPAPVEPPPLVKQPMPDIDWDQIEKAMEKSRKAKMAYNPAGLSEFQAFSSNIANIANQAAAVVQAFKPPQQVIAPQQQLNYGQGASRPVFQAPNYNFSSSNVPMMDWSAPVDYSTPTPLTSDIDFGF